MKKNHIVIISLCLVFFVIIFAGCSTQTVKDSGVVTTTGAGADKEKDPSVKDTWITKEKITLSVMCREYLPTTVDAQKVAVPFEEVTNYVELEKLTNIKLDFMLVPSSSWQERKSLAFASGDLPDLFMCDVLDMKDVDSYGPQQLLIPLDDYINNDISPNVLKSYKSYPLLESIARSPDGKTYALPAFWRTATMGGSGNYVNIKWLSDLGLKKPETTDELYTVLKAFRDNDPAGGGKTVPYCVNGLGGTDFIMTAFDESPQFISVRNKKVESYIASDNYLEYLKYLNILYAEKLLDENYISQSLDEFNAKVNGGYAGITTAAANQPDFNLIELLVPLKSEFNQNPWHWNYPGTYYVGAFAITHLNEYPVESMKLADIFFRHHDDHLDGFCGASGWLGRRGYEWDLVEKEGDIYIMENLKQAEGMDIDNMGLRSAFHVRNNQTPGILDIEYFFDEGVYLQWLGKQFRDFLREYQTIDTRFPTGVRFSAEDSLRASVLRTDIQSYVDQMKARFITGVEPFDNWDVYIKQLNEMGLEEYLKLQQDAYDKFIN